VVEARSSDFIGPDVTANGHLGARVVPALLQGRRPRVLGNPDAVHSWTFVPDTARALVRLAEDDRAWGRAWHVPTAAPYSLRTAVEHMCRIAGVPPVRPSATPWWLLRGLGLFSPTLRELPELSYQFDRPFIVDSTAYSATFGEEPTPADQALAATVAWWQRRLAGSDPASRTAAPPDSAAEGTAVQGTAVQGTAVQGTAVQGTAVQGTSIQPTDSRVVNPRPPPA
jgi:nucleoside-diphosphate-sugar epimerase